MPAGCDIVHLEITRGCTPLDCSSWLRGLFVRSVLRISQTSNLSNVTDFAAGEDRMALWRTWAMQMHVNAEAPHAPVPTVAAVSGGSLQLFPSPSRQLPKPTHTTKINHVMFTCRRRMHSCAIEWCCQLCGKVPSPLWKCSNLTGSLTVAVRSALDKAFSRLQQCEHAVL